VSTSAITGDVGVSPAATFIAPCLLLALASCGIAFGAGTRTPLMPAKFSEAETARAMPPGAPTFGMSLVAGGRAIDAGSLPPPPIRIVAPL